MESSCSSTSTRRPTMISKLYLLELLLLTIAISCTIATKESNDPYLHAPLIFVDLVGLSNQLVPLSYPIQKVSVAAVGVLLDAVKDQLGELILVSKTDMVASFTKDGVTIWFMNLSSGNAAFTKEQIVDYFQRLYDTAVGLYGATGESPGAMFQFGNYNAAGDLICKYAIGYCYFV